MSVLLWLGIVYGVVALIGIGIFLYDGYKYPVCFLCGSNLYCKKIKGKIVCQIHGEIGKKERLKSYNISKQIMIYDMKGEVK